MGFVHCRALSLHQFDRQCLCCFVDPCYSNGVTKSCTLHFDEIVVEPTCDESNFDSLRLVTPEYTQNVVKCRCSWVRRRQRDGIILVAFRRFPTRMLSAWTATHLECGDSF